MSARRSDLAFGALVRRLAMATGLALLAASALSGPPAAAQTQRDPTVSDQVRTIPGNTQLGRLAIAVFPEASIDRKPARFTAGARIYDRSNLIVPPSTLTEPVDVLYRVNQEGQIDAAWVLTPDELAAARRRR